MKKKTNTKLEIKKLNKMKEEIFRSLNHRLESLHYDSRKHFSEIREMIKTIHEISKDSTFCLSIPTTEEIDEVHNINDDHLEVLYECFVRYEHRDDSNEFLLRSRDDRVTDKLKKRDFRRTLLNC
tara:strand:+ start:32 stop:406 length:375 start_codon:yes stop_codon:yes gene_type:complete